MRPHLALIAAFATSLGVASCRSSFEPPACAAEGGLCSFNPVLVAGGISFSTLGAGYEHTCGLDLAGVAYCWGSGFDAGASGIQRAPRRVTTELRFATLRASKSGSTTCGQIGGGTWWCWGSFPLGDSTYGSSAIPRAVAGSHAFVDVALGSRHSCGLLADGAAYCWGMNALGPLGDGTDRDALVPIRVNTSERFVRITAGLDFTCAVTADGVVWCWGSNSSHQIAEHLTTVCAFPGREIECAKVPVRVPTNTRFTSLAAGALHMCALATDRSIHCWGENGQGQLGRTPYGQYGTPTLVAVAGVSAFREVVTGAFQSCGLTDGGGLHCWGESHVGQLGQDANRSNPERPVAVQAGFSFAWITASETHMCGLTIRGLAYCWGESGYGALGGGD